MIDWLFENGGYVVLIGFFAAFCGVAIWIYRPSNRSKIEKMREIPFREGE